MKHKIEAMVWGFMASMALGVLLGATITLTPEHVMAVSGSAVVGGLLVHLTETIFKRKKGPWG